MSGAHEKASTWSTIWPKDANKAVVAICGFVASLITQGAVHGAALHWLSAGLAGATALGVWAVPNLGYQSPSAANTPVTSDDAQQS